MEDCLVCGKHRGERPPPGGVIYEDDLVYASHVYIPDESDHVYLGWLVLERKRHAPGLQNLTDAEAERFGVMQTRIARALREATDAEHIYAFVLGHHVPHLHLHIAARYPGTPREYWALQLPEWPDAPQGGEVEIAELVKRMRELLAK
jgi:diadenosine tetraphosphate (Ap4A) HIT family hydrolase